MPTNEIETELGSEHLTTLDGSSLTHELSSSVSSSSPSPRYQDHGIRAEVAPRRRLKKLRSNKVVRLPSLEVITRKGKEKGSGQIVAGEEFPNYMKTTSSSTAKKETLQKKSGRSLSKLSSFKPGRSLARLSSTKSRRTLMRKSSAGAEMRRKLRKARSVKLANVGTSESILSSNQEEKNTASSCNQSAKLMARTSSLRPLRKLTKVASLRTRRSSSKKASQFQDLHVNKATCSSALKESKFPDRLDLQPGGTPSEGIVTAKVCPYSYCSLHGHHHAATPPLKGFISMRRHQPNAPKTMDCHNSSLYGSRHSSGEGGRIQTRHVTLNGENAAAELANQMKENNTVGRIAESMVESSPGTDHNGPRGSSSAPKETRGKYGDICQEKVDLTNVGMNRKTLQNKSSIYTDDSASNISKNNASIDVADRPLHDMKGVKTTVMVEKISVDGVNSDTGNVTENQFVAREEMSEDAVQDISNATADILPDCVNDETRGSPNRKQMGFWNIIYQQMVSGLAAEDKIQTADGKGEETYQSANTFLSMINTEETQSTSMGDRDGEIQNILLYKNNAIKLVEKAFDKILSEIPDQSPDDQSADREAISDEEAEEINPSEGTTLSISSFSDSPKDNIEQNPEELGRTVDSSRCLNVEKAEANEEREPGKKDFKSWSNVKKILMLNRFVTALEKVKNINPRKPKILPVQPHPEAEKVNLRHLIIGGQEQSQEWMLDYALQKVISTLAPAQKRKVALLVQAFESIIPEISSPTPSSVTISSTATPLDSCANSPDKRISEKEKQTHFGIHLWRREIGDGSSKSEEQLDNCPAVEHRIDAWSESQETSSKHCVRMENGSSIHEITSTDSLSSPSHESKENQHGADTGLLELAETISIDKPSPEATDAPRDHHEEFDKVEESLLEVPDEVYSEPASEGHNLDSASNNQKLEGDNPITETFEKSCGPASGPEKLLEHEKVAPSASSAAQPLETPGGATEAEAQLKGKFLQLFSTLDESRPTSTSGVVQENQFEKQKNTRLWYLIYKHMVSGSTTLLQGAEQAKGDQSNASISVLAQQGSSETNKEAKMNNEEADEFQQIEAIRLVEEAIDEIPLPETQDELPGDPLVSPEKKHLIATEELGKGGKLSIPIANSSSVETKEESVIKGAEQGHDKNTNIEDELKREPSSGNKPKPGMQKSWSNVKKLILLQRFMKSMEKVKKINPRTPRFLPLDATEETEKVSLRHQDIGDRKSSDEWMLDYALQRVVSKLTPARKRKVQLLVEAFETVIPPSWT